MPSILIPARTAAATILRQSQTLRITTPYGPQPVPLWAFVLPSTRTTHPSPQDLGGFPLEFLSTPHTRHAVRALHALPGATLVSNRRRAVATLLSSEGAPAAAHDLVMPACDAYSFEAAFPGLAAGGMHHESCADGLHGAMQRALAAVEAERDGVDLAKIVAGLRGLTPEPVNLFLGVDWGAGRAAVVERGRKGAAVELTAERDLLAVMSACADDTGQMGTGEPVDVEYEVLD